jgi:hypothetical protein
MTYDETNVARAQKIALGSPFTQFILYYPKGSVPPDVRYANVDLKASSAIMDGRFLMHDKAVRLLVEALRRVRGEIPGQTSIHEHLIDDDD